MSDSIEKKAYYAILFEYYKELLTDKQIEKNMNGDYNHLYEPKEKKTKKSKKRLN